MSSIGSISGSALQAFSTSQDVTANNIANINTDNFKASKVTLEEKTGGGVTATAVKTQDSVDISREATNLLISAQGFNANVKALETATDLTKQLFSVKA